MKFIIEDTLANQILNYLAKMPFNQVNDMVCQMQRLQQYPETNKLKAPAPEENNGAEQPVQPQEG